MKRLSIAVLCTLLSQQSVWAEPAQSPALTDSVKAARRKTLDTSQVDHIRVISKALLEAKQRQATDDQRNVLGAELETLHSQLVSQQLALTKAPIRQLDANDKMATTFDRQRAKVGILSNSAIALRSKRAQLVILAVNHPELNDAIKKASDLEAEFNEIAGLAPEEQTQRVNDLSLRLTQHRASEYTGHEKLQPTLVIGRQKSTDE